MNPRVLNPTVVDRGRLGGALIAFQQGDFAQLDPQRVSSASEIGVSRLLHRTLTTVSAGTTGAEVVPDLAQTVGEPSPDFRVWTYRLRHDARYEDGSTVTAADVMLGFERSLDPAITGGVHLHSSYLLTRHDTHVRGEVSGIEIIDTSTIVFRLNRPCPDWPYIVAQPATAAVKLANMAGRPRGLPLSSGPYVVDRWYPGKKMTLARNLHWTRASDSVRTAGPDSITFEFAVPGSQIDRRLLEDEGDDRTAVMLGSALEPDTLAQLHERRALDRLVTATTSCTRFLVLNMERLTDARRRRALAAATNVENFKRARGLTESTSIATVLPPSISGRTVAPSELTCEERRGRVRSLLGTSQGSATSVSLAMPDTESNRAGTAALVQDCDECGIQARVTYIPNAEYTDYVHSHHREFDVLLGGWCALYQSGDAVITPLFGSTNAVQGEATSPDTGIRVWTKKLNEFSPSPTRLFGNSYGTTWTTSSWRKRRSFHWWPARRWQSAGRQFETASFTQVSDRSTSQSSGWILQISLVPKGVPPNDRFGTHDLSPASCRRGYARTSHPRVRNQKLSRWARGGSKYARTNYCGHTQI